MTGHRYPSSVREPSFAFQRDTGEFGQESTHGYALFLKIPIVF